MVGELSIPIPDRPTLQYGTDNNLYGVGRYSGFEGAFFGEDFKSPECCTILP